MNEPDAYVFSYCSCDLSVGQGMCCSSRAAGARYAMACARDAHVSWAPILFALMRCVPVWCEGESMWTREAGSAATCIVHESVVSGQLDTGPSRVGPTVRSGHWRMARDRDRAPGSPIARIEGSYISCFLVLRAWSGPDCGFVRRSTSDARQSYGLCEININCVSTSRHWPSPESPRHDASMIAQGFGLVG